MGWIFASGTKQMNTYTLGLGCLFSVSLLALAACNSSSSAIKGKDSSKTEVAAAQPSATDASQDVSEEATTSQEPKELAKVVNKPGKVKNRGAFIKILVNKTPITNFDIQRRVKFLQLRRIGGNRSKVAENELIEQVLKLQEAKLRRTVATDEQVNTAFGKFAQQNRAKPAQLSRELGRLGVGAPHFKEFIRTQISWQRTVQGRFQAETRRVSEQQAIKDLRESGGPKPKVAEYTFKQVIFVVPQNKRSATTLGARKREANAFRQTVGGCDNLLSGIKTLRDVSVLDRRHIMEPELPERWKESIAAAGVNGTTPAQETEKGVEFMVVCNSRVVDDDRAARVTKQSSDFTSFNEKSSAFAKKYLDELRERATIVYQ